MNSLDLTPFYRSSIGYDRLGSLINSTLSGSDHAASYPPYNIEILGENEYAITVAVAGFEKNELDINVENGVLTIRGRKDNDERSERDYLYQGIANRTFERKFNLAEHVEVTTAKLNNGLLSINLVREIPEAMKPKTIAINDSGIGLEQQTEIEPNDSGHEAA